MNQRTKRRIDTGFRSLRDLALFAFGGWMFWVLVTRVRDPSPWALGVCAVFLVAPSALAAWRLVSEVFASRTLDEERLRKVIRDEMGRGGSP